MTGGCRGAGAARISRLAACSLASVCARACARVRVCECGACGCVYTQIYPYLLNCIEFYEGAAMSLTTDSDVPSGGFGLSLLQTVPRAAPLPSCASPAAGEISGNGTAGRGAQRTKRKGPDTTRGRGRRFPQSPRYGKGARAPGHRRLALRLDLRERGWPEGRPGAVPAGSGLGGLTFKPSRFCGRAEDGVLSVKSTRAAAGKAGRGDAGV